MKGCAVARVAD